MSIIMILLVTPMTFAVDIFQIGGFVSSGEDECDYYIGDAVQFSQSYSEYESFFNKYTGEGLYQYCVWSLDKDGEHEDGEFYSITTGYCPDHQILCTFSEAGVYNYTSKIIGVNLTQGVPGTPYIIDEVSESYRVCYSPPDDPMNFWDIIKFFICNTMGWTWFWFCEI